MSKLALGTVQFGLDYGILNDHGQVEIDEARSILDFAINNGVSTLDTAASYGNSEKILGIIGTDGFDLITKTQSKRGAKEVLKNFYQSLVNLKKTRVYGLLIHGIEDVQYNQIDSVFNSVLQLKREGLVNKIGFSVYSPEQVDFVKDNFEFDLIQVPFNVFDNRLIYGGQLEALKRMNVEVHARSVFLQGILLGFDKLPNYFKTWEVQFKEYEKIVEKSGLSLIEYALNFVLSVNDIDKAIVGVNSKKHLIEITQSVNIKSNPHPYPIHDKNLLNPSLWKDPKNEK